MSVDPVAPRRRKPRLAAGRARALGVPTRGTTAPNRLRRVDRWIVGTQGHVLRSAEHPLVVDLGYGSSPVTTVELARRLWTVREDIRVVGLEIDPVRVEVARAAAEPPLLEFRRGGFEFAGLRPTVVRALNVLRQYDEKAAGAAWDTMVPALAPGGILVEGTCCELGRVACWVTLDAAGPRQLTLAAKLSTLDEPGILAERLPKSLIHHNVPGRRVHTFFKEFRAAWAATAPLSVYGTRQRWAAAAAQLAATGWPILDRHPRWRLGELTVPWTALAD